MKGGHRRLSLQAGLAMLERDLKLANRLGFKNMRLLVGTPLDVTEKAIPLAEKYDVWMGFEIHWPLSVKSRLVDAWMAMIEMTEDYRETSIPYEEVIPVLVAAGFDASVVSEYEGQRHTQDLFETDSCEQVRATTSC